MKITKRSEKGERKRGEQESSRGHKFSILENSCPFGTASCWGVPAPNPAGTSTANWKLFYLRSINPMIEKINPTIPIPITSSPIPDEQRESIMAKSSIAIPNPIFFIVNPPLQMPICCLIFVFKLYHKTCEQFYRNFGLYENSPNSFLPGLPRSIVNQFRFHNLLCLCLASVHLPHPFHLVFGF